MLLFVMASSLLLASIASMRIQRLLIGLGLFAGLERGLEAVVIANLQTQ